MRGTGDRIDVNGLWAINTCCDDAFAALRVRIFFAISRTWGAGLADDRKSSLLSFT